MQINNGNKQQNRICTPRFFSGPAGLFTAGVVLLCSVILALFLGSAKMSLSTFFASLMGQGDARYILIVYHLRLPRVLGAVLSGVGLSVSGVLLQSVTGNKLASPNLIGVNAGAGFAVVVFLCFFPLRAMFSAFAAFLGAFLTTILIVSIAQRMGSSKSTVILSGIAVTALLSAAISFLTLLDEDVLSLYTYFSVGSLSSVSLQALLLPSVLIVLCFIFCLLLAKKVQMLMLGDALAVSLGVRVRTLRLVLLLLASTSAASVVSFAGLLGFVGLIVPHMAQRLCGENMRYTMSMAALLGATLVVLADLCGRVLLSPTEIPVGIVMAFLGVPFFFWLLFRKEGRDDTRI